MKIVATFLLCLIQIVLFGQNKVTVIIHSFKNYDGYENFANMAAKKLEIVLNSEKFKQAILTGSFTKIDTLTNQQIYDAIMKAHEVQGDGGQDGVVDLRVRTITLEQDGKKWIRNCKIGSWAGTIGIDGQGDGITAICSERLKLWADSSDYAQLAAHYAHEYMHIIGFSHFGRKKGLTLVYQVGDIVERLIKEGA
jgi:hypothetical protein